MVVVTNLPPPDHGIRHQQPATSAVIGDKVLGKGTLYIAESHLSWVNGASGDRFSLEYPHISIHAVSRDHQAYPEECLYLLLDTKISIDGDRPQQEGESNQEEQPEGNEEEEENSMTEIRFVPEDKNSLQPMYEAMSDCQALHPDAQDSFSEDDDDEDEGLEDDDGIDDFDNPGANHPTNGGQDMDVDEGQFEDATE